MLPDDPILDPMLLSAVFCCKNTIKNNEIRDLRAAFDVLCAGVKTLTFH